MLGLGRIMSYGCFKPSCVTEQINRKAVEKVGGTLLRRISTLAGAGALLAVALPPVAYAVPTAAHLAPLQTTVDTLGTGFGNGPRYLAIDSSGNLYVGVPSTNSIIKETPGAGGTYTATTISTVASQTNEGVGVDASGNVYAVFRDSLGNTNTFKYTPTTPGGNTYTTTTIPNPIGTTETVSDMAVDAAGDLYLLTNDADGSNVFLETNTGGVYSLTNPITINTITAYAIAVDTPGNLYITEPNTVVKETPGSTPGTYNQTTVASGVGSNQAGVTVDPSGIVYISKFAGGTIYKETPSGGSYLQTIAAIQQVAPFGLAADASGNVFVAETGAQHVHKEAPAPTTDFGIVSDVMNVSMDQLVTFLFDSGGTVSSAGVVNDGSISTGYQYNPIGSCNSNGPSHVYQPGDTCQIQVTFSPTAAGIFRGAAFITDGSGNKIASGFIEGVGQLYVIGLDQAVIGPVSTAGVPAGSQLNGLTIAADGTMYVPDGNSCSIYEYPQGVAPPVLLAGTGTCGTSSGDGSVASATTGFSNPVYTAIDGAGSLYIVDGNTIRKIDGQSGIISTVAGIQGSTAYRPDGGPALGGPLGGLPRALAVDGSGNVYFSVGDTVREIIARSGLLYTVAGKISLGTGFSGDGGQARNAQFNSVAGIAFDLDGNLYAADQMNNIVRRIATDGTITTVAGVAPAPYNGSTEPSNHGHGADGTTATAAMLDQPTGIALDPAGDLYIADSNNFLVRRVNTATPGVMSTVAGLYNGGGGAGSPNSANTGDGGAATAAGLGHLRDVALDPKGNVYLVVDDQHVIRMVNETQGVLPNFPDTVVGSTSAAQDATVNNNGNGPLPFDGVTASTDFSLGGADTSCSTSASVPPGGSCVMGVEFAPTATGLLTGTASISEYNGDGDDVQSVTVNGVGTNNPPTQIALSTIPAAVFAGSNLGTVTVSIEAADASVSTTATNSVTVTITGPASFTPITIAAVNGVATFNLSADVFTVPGTYTITATSSGLTTSTATFLVSLPATQLALTGVPSTLVAGGNLGAGVMVAVEDVNGAVVASASTAVTLTVTGPFGFSQAFTATAVNGIATFNLASTPLAEGGVYTATASGGSLTSSAPATVTVTAQTGALALSVSPDTAAQGAPVTLLATATMGSAPVLHGTVTFNYTQVVNGVTLTGSFGSGQLLTSGPNAGTSTLVVRPGIGTYTVTAVFAGTAATTAATSAATTLTITGTTPIATASTITASGSPGDYTLTATVGVFGLLSAPTGNVSFLNTTASNTSLATAALDPATFNSTFIPTGPAIADPNISEVFSADLNGDGIADLITLTSIDANHQHIEIRLGLGNGLFAAATSFSPGTYLGVMAIGDLNNDGYADIVVSTAYGGVVVLLGHGDGTFTLPPFTFGPYVPFTGGNPQAIALVDVNNDGNLDILTANSGASGTVGVLLGDGTGAYTTPVVTYPAGSYPAGIAVADLNHDGKLDVIVGADGNPNPGVYTLLGNGDGTFQPSVKVPGSLAAHSVATGSLRGNGTLDLVAATNDITGFSVFLGNNDGTFGSGTSYPTPFYLQQVQLADLNHDGKLDVAALSDDFSTPPYPGLLSTFTGNGDGTFGTEQDLPLGTFAGNFALGDFNNDGLLDVAAGNYGISSTLTGSIPILFGVQAATATATGIAVPGPGPVQNVDASYAGDSTHIASVSTTVPLLPAPSTTTISDTPLSGAPGTPVTVTATVSSTVLGPASNGTVSFYNLAGNVLITTVNVASGTASFTTSTLPPGLTNIYAVYSGSDNLATSTSLNLPVFVGPQTSTTLAVSANTVVNGTPVVLTATALNLPGNTPVTPGEVNFTYVQTINGVSTSGSFGTVQMNSAGIAVLSVAPGPGSYVITAVFAGTTGSSLAGPSASAPQTVVVSGNGSFATTSVLTSTGTVGNYTLVAAITGPGFPAPSGVVSFLDTTANTTVTTATIDPASAFASLVPAAASPLTDPSVTWVATGDFNNDGLADIVNVTSTGLVLARLGNGDGSFQAAVNPPTGLAYTQAAVGDVNNDGKQDIIALSNSGNEIDLYLGDGTGTFTALAGGSPQQIATGTGPISLVTGDFNHDGNLDMAVLDDGSLQIFLGAGNGTFASSTISIGDGLAGMVVGDFNDDGIPDLAISLANGTVMIYTGVGDGTFTAGTTFTLPTTESSNPSPGPISTGSLRHNGILDLVVADSVNGYLYPYLGNNDGTFTAALPLSPNGYPTGTILADVDHDGNLDIVFTDGTQLAVFYGVGDGTFGSEYDYNTGQGGLNVASADFNHDGLLDFITSDSTDGTNTILLGFETATATAAAAYIPGAGDMHMVDASYPGDTSHLASVSPAISLQSGVQSPSTLVLTSSSTAIAFGGSVTLTATVSPTPSSATLGTVAFYLNGTLLATRPVIANGTAVLTTTTLPVGTDGITAVYSGDAGLTTANTTSAVFNITVSAVATATSLTVSNLTPVFGQTVTLTATVAPVSTDSPSGTVSFYSGTTLLGTAQPLGTSGVVTLNIVLPLGPDTVKAVYSGTPNFSTSTSATIAVSNRAASGVTFTASPTPQLFNNPINLTAQVSSATTGAPSGTVSFLDGTTVITTCPVGTGGQVACTITTLAPGSHALTAMYSGDTSFLASASTGTPVAITVGDLNLALGGDTNKTVVPGAAVTYNFPLSPLVTPTFIYDVTLTATGLPPGATYTFVPSTIPAGSGTLPVALTIQTVIPTSAMLRQNPAIRTGRLAALALGLLLPFAGARRVRARLKALPRSLTLLLFAVLSLSLATGLSGCGSKGFFGDPLSGQSFTITVHATSADLVRTSTVQLNFQ